MTKQMQAPLPVPDWINKHPREWPPEARSAWSILALGAERRLKAEAEAAARQAQQTGKAA